MRLKVQFGFIDSREVSWWGIVEDFPHLIKFLGRNYEWVYYDKDLTGKVDMVLIYSEVQSHEPNYNKSCPLWNDMFPNPEDGCECGAKFTSFSFDHMRYCRLWSPW